MKLNEVIVGRVIRIKGAGGGVGHIHGLARHKLNNEILIIIRLAGDKLDKEVHPNNIEYYLDADNANKREREDMNNG